MRVAGVLGGLGPAATIGFMQRVLEFGAAGEEQEHVPLLVNQNPGVPNRQQAILEAGPSPGPALAEMARALERAGADFLVMPCATAHAWQQEIADASTLPLASIVDASLRAVPADAATIGVLETPACRRAGLFTAALLGAGLDYCALADDECAKLMKVAYAVKGGDRGIPQKKAAVELAAVLARRGARAIIAACTELPLVLSGDDVDVPLVVSTDALAEQTVAIARGALPLPARP